MEETKICSKCGRELPISQFPFRNKAKGTRRANCKECHNQYMKNKYQENKQKLQDLKSQMTCVKCGEKRGYVLDFHHINPDEKEYTISHMIANHYSFDNKETQNEIKKCVVLCANCHREWHHFKFLFPDLIFEDYLNGNIPESSNR